MSPQMNGELREAASSTADHASAAISPASAMQDGDRPLLQAVNTDGVTRTTLIEDKELAPLFTQAVAMDFRSRWDFVERRFLRRPRGGVTRR
jgi:hypothetical protein